MIATPNPEQQLAIDSDEKRILVLAGAGSGKTNTLIEKIKYYIKEKHIPAKKILAITFTRDAAHEIMDRLIEYQDKKKRYAIEMQYGDPDEVRKKYKQKYAVLKNLTVCTFHSLCYSILKADGAPHFDSEFKLLLDKNESAKLEEVAKDAHAGENILSVFRKSVIAACQHDPVYYRELQKYLMEHKLEKEYEQPQYTKSYNNKEYKCLNKAIVKSKSEQKLVDWFWGHGYDVEYEPLVAGARFLFKPDLRLSNHEFYVEHKSDLSADLTDKLKELQRDGKPYFITYEEWMQDSEKIERELMRILNRIIECNHSADFSKEFDNKFRFLGNELRSYIKEVKQVYDLAKSRNMEIEDVQGITSELFKHRRIRIFYDLLPVVWKQYDGIKKNNSLVDFNDLISIALKILKEEESVRTRYNDKFSCILVDEFQDVNTAQVELIKVLLKENTHLFCVGDDWQSIYGFRGSDVNYILNFSQYFPGAQIFKLKYNFRSTEHIVEVGNGIIKNNKNKIDKEVQALRKGEQKVILFNSNSDEDTIDFIKEKITFHLENDRNIKQKEVLILGRRRDHFKGIQQALKRKGIRFSTIHKAKGQESKVVFIMGLKHGYQGFPDTWLSNSIFQVIKKTDNSILLEEERRLFYVAITRARDYLYLLSEYENQSQFIDELPGDFVDSITSGF